MRFARRRSPAGTSSSRSSGNRVGSSLSSRRPEKELAAVADQLRALPGAWAAGSGKLTGGVEKAKAGLQDMLRTMSALAQSLGALRPDSDEPCGTLN